MAPHSSTLAWKIPWMEEESDTTERLHFHFSLSCIGEGNGNPLQCSCQENPRDGEAWWAAIYGVARSRTRLKQLSSSSRIYHRLITKFAIIFSPFFISMAYGTWLWISSHDEVACISHPLMLCWVCDLFWPTQWVRCNILVCASIYSLGTKPLPCK